MKVRGTKKFSRIITKTLRANGVTLNEFAKEMDMTVAGVYARFRNNNAKFSKKERYICEKYLGKEWERLIINVKSVKKDLLQSSDLNR